MYRKVNEWEFVPESFKSFNHCSDNDHKVETQSDGSVEAGWCQSVNRVKTEKNVCESFFCFVFFSELVRRRQSCVFHWIWHKICVPLFTSLIRNSFSFLDRRRCLGEFLCNTNVLRNVKWHKPVTRCKRFRWIILHLFHNRLQQALQWHIQQPCDVNIKSLCSTLSTLTDIFGGAMMVEMQQCI